MKDCLVEYIRKKKSIYSRGIPVGCLFAIKSSTGTYCIGWSKYDEQRELAPFNKKNAFVIAKGRAEKKFLYERDRFGFFIKNPMFPKSIEKQMANFITRCQKYFKDCKLFNLIEE